MKKRIGFVSNSSTSSFCILGIEVNGIEEEKMRKMVQEKHPDEFKVEKVRACECDIDTDQNFCPNCGTHVWEEVGDSIEDLDVYELLELVCQKTPLYFHNYDGDTYIGLGEGGVDSAIKQGKNPAEVAAEAIKEAGIRPDIETTDIRLYSGAYYS